MSDRDRRLCELMGMCDHKWRYYSAYALCGDVSDHKCDICGAWKSATSDPNFSLPEWRAKLMDFCVEQEWWFNFEQFALEKRVETKPFEFNYSRYLWRNLPELVDEYRREK